MRKFSLLPFSIILLVIIIVNPFLQYNLPPLLARVLHIFTFFVPLLWIVGSIITRKVSRSIYAITFFSIPLFILIEKNLIQSPQAFLLGVPSEVHLLAQEYNKVGTLVFATEHSYFFQAPFLVYVISSFSGMPFTYVSFVLSFCFVVLMALVGLYLLKILAMRTDTASSAVLPVVLVFSLFSSGTLIYVPLSYRDFGSLLLILLMCYLFDRGHRHRRDPIVALILVSGITLGSPEAGLLMVLFFLIFSVLRRNGTMSVYAIIPLGYLIYSGLKYTLSLRKYSIYALEGFARFLKEVFGSKLPERVAPWGRLSLLTEHDLYIASMAYLALLSLSAIIVLLFTYIWIYNKRVVRRNSEKNVLLRTGCLCLWLILISVTVTYIGSSVKPEVPFSDIRTLVFMFIGKIFPFIFISKSLIKKINFNKALLFLVLLLSVTSSLRVVYEIYPKSVYDPVNVIEDSRLDIAPVYYAGIFLKNFRTSGTMVADYKTFHPLYAFVWVEPYKIFALQESTLEDPASTLIVFDTNGLKLNSIYTSFEVYVTAYKMSLKQNMLYDNGAIIISKKLPHISLT